MSKSNENSPITISVSLGSIAAAGLLPVVRLPKKSKIVSAHVTDGAGIAASDTDYVTLSLKSGATVLASLDSRAANQGALTAAVGKAMVVVTATQPMAAGADLSLLYAEGGTMALTNAVLSLTYIGY